MARERLYLFDTTLRDGAQTNGVDFTLADKLAIAGMLDELGIDYVEGGYPGANPTDTELFADDRNFDDDLHRLRHDAAAGPLGLERSGARRAARGQGRRHLLRRQVLGLPRARRAGDDGRGKPRLDPRQRARRQGQGPRSAARLRAFLRRLQGQSEIRAGLRQGGLRRRRALGGAVRHQWRHAAARGRNDRRRGGARPSPAIMSASMPTTTPSRRWPIRSPRCAPARARSRARSTGWASAAATPISSRSSRRSSSSRNSPQRFDIGVSDAAAQEAGAGLARARRAAQPRLQPARALCRRERLRHQGRHPCLRHREGPGDLRARGAGQRRQQAQGAGVGAGRQIQHSGRARPHRHQGRQGRSAHRPPAGDRQGARDHRLRLRGGGRLVRNAGAPHARHGAELFRRHPVRRQCRAAQQRQRRARHRHAWRWSR